jgi:hypothetical protein
MPRRNVSLSRQRQLRLLDARGGFNFAEHLVLPGKRVVSWCKGILAAVGSGAESTVALRIPETAE